MPAKSYRDRLAAVLAAAEATFTAGEVCAMLGIEPGTLRAWRSRGLLKIEGSGGKWVRYSAQDVARIRKLQTRLAGRCPHCNGSLEDF